MSFLKEADPTDVHTALDGFSTYVPGTENRVRFERSVNKLTLIRNTESGQETLLEIKHIVDEVGRLLHVVFVEKFDYAGAAGHLRMPYLFNEELVGVVIGHICQIEDIVLLANKETLEAALMDHLRAQLVGKEAQVYGLDGMTVTCYAETGEVAGQLEFRLFGPENEGLVLTREDYEGVLATYEQVEPTHHKEMPWTSLRIHRAEGHAGYIGLMTYPDPSTKQVIDILADVIVEKGAARTWEDAVNAMLHYLETQARAEESGEESYAMNA